MSAFRDYVDEECEKILQAQVDEILNKHLERFNMACAEAGKAVRLVKIRGLDYYDNRR